MRHLTLVAAAALAWGVSGAASAQTQPSPGSPSRATGDNPYTATSPAFRGGSGPTSGDSANVSGAGAGANGGFSGGPGGSNNANTAAGRNSPGAPMNAAAPNGATPSDPRAGQHEGPMLGNAAAHGAATPSRTTNNDSTGAYQGAGQPLAANEAGTDSPGTGNPNTGTGLVNGGVNEGGSGGQGSNNLTPPVGTPQASTAVHNSATEKNSPGVPIPGANSFTEGQARSRMEDHGFKDISDLKLDKDGIWRGTATQDGKHVTVALDYQGNVVAQ